MGKQEFINKELKQNFKSANSDLAKYVDKGYHSSLRNAFAHSEYYFDIFGRKKILLDNFKNKSWELSEISFDEWSNRFTYSVLLSFNLLTLMHEKRVNLVEDFGTDEFLISHPKESGDLVDTKIIYVSKNDNFAFKP